MSIHAIEQPADYREQLRKVRREAEAEIDRLLLILDTIDEDPDIEEEDEREPDNDLEPSLGSVNPTTSNGQGNWSAGGDADLEDEHDGSEPDHEGDELDTREGSDTEDMEPDEDGEPSLGWTIDGAMVDIAFVDRELEGYVLSKKDIELRGKLGKLFCKRSIANCAPLSAGPRVGISNVSLVPSVVGRSRLRLPSGKMVR